jgi:hypothetical protein
MLTILNMMSVAPVVINTAASPFPPSFDNNPMVFAWALFARMLVFSLASATVVKIMARNAAERLPTNHPVYYHRLVMMCFLWTAIMGSSSDVMTYLFWGEASVETTSFILLLCRVIDACTMAPFVMALFVPVWMRWLRNAGWVRFQPTIVLNGVINDVRVTWTSATIPLQLLTYSLIASGMVTVGKYLLWVEHALR